MRVLLNTSFSGPSVDRRAGEEYDIPDPEAKRLIERGLATPVRSKKPEKAVSRAPEKATKTEG